MCLSNCRTLLEPGGVLAVRSLPFSFDVYRLYEDETNSSAKS
jgi:hypothetical protein